MSRDTDVKALFDALHQTLPYFDQPAAALNRSYAPDKWTMREVLVHISDTETVMLDRLRRLAAEDKAVLQSFDQDLWQTRLFYKSRDLNLVRQQYETARRSILELLRTLDTPCYARTGTHSAGGSRSFAEIVERAVWHNTHHLEQLRACAENRTWQKS